MIDVKKIAIKGTTQEHLPFEDIAYDLVILKDGSCAMILEVSSVNFDLLSEREQDAMIYAYKSLINSLSFPIQIFIRTSLKDVSKYLEKLDQQEKRIVNPLLKKQILSYRQFVSEIVKKNNVLSKDFYVVIPFSIFELGLQSVKAAIPGGKKQTELPFTLTEIIQKAKVSLEPKRQQLIGLLSHLGLSARQLTTKELTKLFYQIYNFSSAMPDFEEDG